MNIEDKSVCPVEYVGGLDNALRRFLQNPQKLLRPYIQKGMSVLDLGCGPGFFTIEIAKLLSDTDTVIAADLQDGMLEKVRQKIKGTLLEERIKLHKCNADRIGVTEKVDFVLAFYMIHEVPDHKRLFNELKSIIKRGGRMLIIEPKLHVSKKSFDEMVKSLEYFGFEVIDRPKIFFSKTVLLENKN